jgi:hypothetical protein
LQTALDGKLGVLGNAVTATTALQVDDAGAGGVIKFWYGTEAQYQAIPTKDGSTLYFRSA